MVRGSVGKVRLATVAHNTTNPFTIHKSTNHHNHHHQQTTTNTTRYQICIQDEDWTAFCHCLCFFYFREFVTSLILRMWNKTSHNIWKSHLLGRPLSNWTLSEQKTRQVAEGVGAGDGKRWMCHRVPLCRLRNPSQPRTTRDPGQPKSRAYPDPTKKHHNESVLYY